MQRLSPCSMAWRSSKGRKVPWNEEDVTKAAASILELLPEKVTTLLDTGRFKGVRLINVPKQKLGQKDVIRHQWIWEPVLQVCGNSLHPPYYLADVLLALNVALDCKLLLAESPTVQALQDAHDLKRLIAKVRRLCGNVGSRHTSIGALKQLMSKDSFQSSSSEQPPVDGDVDEAAEVEHKSKSSRRGPHMPRKNLLDNFDSVADDADDAPMQRDDAVDEKPQQDLEPVSRKSSGSESGALAKKILEPVSLKRSGSESGASAKKRKVASKGDKRQDDLKLYDGYTMAEWEAWFSSADSDKALVQSAAEQLPYRIDAGEPAIGGEAVGNLCEALVQMKMLGEEFTGLVCGMLRTDWDRMWSAQALGQAAEYLERARCRDSRAWRALLHRATMELPGIDQGDLARLLNACTAAGIRSERFMSILVDHLLEDDWHLTAEMTACLCRMLASPREVGEDLWKNVLVLDRLLRAIPRHASALAVGDLWPAMATSLKVVDTTSTLGGLHSLASSSLRSLLVALRRYAHALRIEEAEALLPLFARAADAGVEDGDLYSSIVMQACQQSRRGAMDSLSQGNSMSLALAAVLLHVAQGRHALGSNHLALHSAVVSSLSDLTKQLPLSSSSPGERWLMVCRLLATYGFAQANSESTLRALLQQFEAALSGGLPKPEQLDGLAITLPGLAAMQFRLPGRIRTSVLACLAASARRRQKRRRSLTSTAPGMGSSILTSLPVALSLLELDGVHSPQDLKLLCDVLGDSQDQLSTQVLASLTLSMLSRLPWQAPCQQYDGDAPAGAWCQAAIDTLSRRLLGTQDDLSSTGLPPGFPNLSTTTDAIRMISMLLFASSSSTCQLGTIPLETARKLGELHRRGDFPANSSGSGRIEPLGDGSGTIASELLASLQHLFARKKVRTDYMVEVSSELKTPVTSCGDAEGMVLLPKCFADMFSIRIAVLQPRHFSRSQSPVAIRERSTLTIFHPRKQMKMVQ